MKASAAGLQITQITLFDLQAPLTPPAGPRIGEDLPDAIYEEFVNKAAGMSYPHVLSLRTLLQSVTRPASGGPTSKQLWNASVRYCREHISPKQYITDYRDLMVPVELPKPDLQSLTSQLAAMTDEGEILTLLEHTQAGDEWWFSPSDYCCVFLAKSPDPKEVLEILTRCGRISSSPRKPG